MTQKQLKNIAASVRQRLTNLARKEGRPFQEVLQYYVMERFLHRLSHSDYSETFILKGGLMLRVWGGPDARPTMDIDLLGITSNEIGNVVEIMKHVCQTEVQDDGVIYEAERASGNIITKDGDYKGVRVTIPCSLAGARLMVQIDTGFGDAVYPKPEVRELPQLLDQDITRLRCYSNLTLIAEKFEAMVHLGELNSRVKDFFDIWLLSRTCSFDGAELLEAIRQTFDQRATSPPSHLSFLESEFADKRSPNWKSFRKKMKRDNIPEEFSQIVFELIAFLEPVNKALLAGKTLDKWLPGEDWKE